MSTFQSGDRVVITSRRHPWKGAAGRISGTFQPNARRDPDLRWKVALEIGLTVAASTVDLRVARAE